MFDLMMLVHDDYDYEANEYERHFIEDENYAISVSQILVTYYEIVNRNESFQNYKS